MTAFLIFGREVTVKQLNHLQICTEATHWPVKRTSTLSSLRCALCASFSLVFTSGYWFCRNSSSSASSCSSVKMVRWRLVRRCAWGELCSSLRVSPDLQGSGSVAAGHTYWQAAEETRHCISVRSEREWKKWKYNSLYCHNAKQFKAQKFNEMVGISESWWIKSGAPTFWVKHVSTAWAEAAAADAGAMSSLHLHGCRTGCTVSESSAGRSTWGIPAQYVVNSER